MEKKTKEQELEMIKSSEMHISEFTKYVKLYGIQRENHKALMESKNIYRIKAFIDASAGQLVGEECHKIAIELHKEGYLERKFISSIMKSGVIISESSETAMNKIMNP